MFKKRLVENPLNYWEEKSYMMIVPEKNREDLLKVAFDRLSKQKDIELIDNKYDASKNVFDLRLGYENAEYEVGMYIGGISVPEYYVNNYLFKKEDREKLLRASTAITIFMEFKGNVKKCYRFQLKLAVTLVPDLIGVLDESAEKMLPAEWVNMTAKSKVLPSAKNLFSVQAVIGDNENVWLHTHGLLRCGVNELEIVDSNEENRESHYNLISAYGMYLLDKKESVGAEDGVYIGRLANGCPVVVTNRSWTVGLDKYKHLKLGNAKDRKYGHNTKTNIIFLYTSQENEQNRVIDKVSLYDEFWADNPLFYFSDEETQRMKDVAIESFDRVKKAFKNKDNAILIKIGLPLSEDDSYEHIWFELLEVKGKEFKAELTQEPYYFKDMHKGDIKWFQVSDITDWIVYTKEFAVTPDVAFLLDRE